jgi:hypothetical protein
VTTRSPGAALALAVLLAARVAAAQDDVPHNTPDTDVPAAEAFNPAAPSERIPDPPPPADLSAAPRPALPADVADLSLAPGFARIPAGGWRITGRAAEGQADPASRQSMETIGRYLAEQTTGRITVIAQTSAPTDDPPVARRASLARAISVKASLVRGGLPGTRIDIRPMGRTEEEVDAIDIIAPPAARPREAAAATPAASGTAQSPSPSPAPNTAPSRPSSSPRGG